MSTMWQYPYVDVFKSFSLTSWRDSVKEGNVTEVLEKNIGRRVQSIRGLILANNYFQLPHPKAIISTLGLTGRHIYILAQGVKTQNFTIHLDFTFANGNNMRLSFSNIYKETTWKNHSFSVQVPLVLPPEKWSVVCLDTKSFFHKFKLEYNLIYLDQDYVLKQCTFSGNLNVWRLVTADFFYRGEEIPKECNFKVPVGAKWDDLYDFYTPLAPMEGGRPPIKGEDLGKKKEGPPKQPRIPIKEKENIQPIAPTPHKLLSPDPIINLDYIMGFNGGCKNLQFEYPPQTRGECVLFGSGSILVSHNLDTQQQSFYVGHSAPISCYAVDPQGLTIATAQEGHNPMIRVWDVSTHNCITSLATVVSEIQSLSFSAHSHFLSSVGKEAHNKEQILIWNLASIRLPGGKAEMYARQISMFNILEMKFSPFDKDKLVSCGQENIRFWRIKAGHLPGSAVVLIHHARNTVFSCLDFECGTSSSDQITNESLKRVFVGSKHGMVFQVNYHSQELEAVFQLHSEGIHCLAVNSAFCVTGSADQFLRVWPLDFKEFFLEAKHEGTVTGLSISKEGMRVICGTESGSLGSLQISEQRYHTVLRSHIGSILHASVHNAQNSLITISDDHTIRLWNLESHEQISEFTSAHDPPCSVAAHPSEGIFAVGFKSGSLRLFDIDRTTVIMDFKHFDTPLTTLIYMMSVNLLFTMANDGSVCFHNASLQHQPIKSLDAEIRGEEEASANCSGDEKILAMTGENGMWVNLLDTSSLSIIHRFPTPGLQIVQIGFIPGVRDTLIVLSKQGEVVYYNLEGKVLKRAHVGDGRCMLISPDSQYLLIGCHGGHIKVIDNSFILGEVPDIQTFVGHHSGINQLLFDPLHLHKLISMGGPEGIFIWHFKGGFLGELTTTPFGERPNPNTTIQEETKYPEDQIIFGDQDEHEEEDKVLLMENNLDLENRRLESQQFNSLCNFDINVHMSASLATISKIQNELPSKILRESVSVRRSEENKVYKQFVSEEPRGPIEESSILLQKEHERGMKEGAPIARLVMGYNGNARDNLVWNEEEGWIAYSLNNKVIVETIQGRKQRILTPGNTEISTICLSPNKRLLACGSGSRTASGSAEITIYKTDLFTEQKKLRLHSDGVQSVVFTGDSKYLLSLGVSMEGTIAIWEIERGIAIASSHRAQEQNCILPHWGNNQEMVTLGGSALRMWSLHRDKLDYLEQTYVPRMKERSFQFTAGCYTPYIPSTHRNYLLLGTNIGSIVVYDPSIQEFQGEYPVYEGQISCLFCSPQAIMLGGSENTIYRWPISPTQKEWFNTPPLSLSLDSGVVAMHFGAAGHEGQVGTDLGTVWYINWAEALAIKLINSHANANITQCSFDNKLQSLMFITAGSDYVLKVWSSSTCDQLIQFEIPSTQCTALGMHPRKNYAVAAFADGNLRFLDLTKLANMGKLKISGGSINSLAFAPIGDSLLVGDSTGGLYIVNVQSWDILSATHQKVTSMDGSVSCVDFSNSGNKDQFLGGVESGKIVVWRSAERRGEIYSLKGDTEFIAQDVFDLFENPHGEPESLIPSRKLYMHSSQKVEGKFTLTQPNLYIAITDSLQYLYLRDTLLHSVKRRISLLMFPVAISLHPNGRGLAIATKNNLIKYAKDMEVENLLTVMAHNEKIFHIAFDTAGTSMLTASYGEAIIWNIPQA